MCVGKLEFGVGLLSDGKLNAVVYMCISKPVMEECPSGSPARESSLSWADTAISTHDPLANGKIFRCKKDNCNDFTNLSYI